MQYVHCVMCTMKYAVRSNVDELPVFKGAYLFKRPFSENCPFFARFYFTFLNI